MPTVHSCSTRCLCDARHSHPHSAMGKSCDEFRKEGQKLWQARRLAEAYAQFQSAWEKLQRKYSDPKGKEYTKRVVDRVETCRSLLCVCRQHLEDLRSSADLQQSSPSSSASSSPSSARALASIPSSAECTRWLMRGLSAFLNADRLMRDEMTQDAVQYLRSRNVRFLAFIPMVQHFCGMVRNARPEELDDMKAVWQQDYPQHEQPAVFIGFLLGIAWRVMDREFLPDVVRRAAAGDMDAFREVPYGFEDVVDLFFNEAYFGCVPPSSSLLLHLERGQQLVELEQKLSHLLLSSDASGDVEDEKEVAVRRPARICMQALQIATACWALAGWSQADENIQKAEAAAAQVTNDEERKQLLHAVTLARTELHHLWVVNTHAAVLDRAQSGAAWEFEGTFTVENTNVSVSLHAHSPTTRSSAQLLEMVLGITYQECADFLKAHADNEILRQDCRAEIESALLKEPGPWLAELAEEENSVVRAFQTSQEEYRSSLAELPLDVRKWARSQLQSGSSYLMTGDVVPKELSKLVADASFTKMLANGKIAKQAHEAVSQLMARQGVSASLFRVYAGLLRNGSLPMSYTVTRAVAEHLGAHVVCWTRDMKDTASGGMRQKLVVKYQSPINAQLSSSPAAAALASASSVAPASPTARSAPLPTSSPSASLHDLMPVNERKLRGLDAQCFVAGSVKPVLHLLLECEVPRGNKPAPANKGKGVLVQPTPLLFDFHVLQKLEALQSGSAAASAVTTKAAWMTRSTINDIIMLRLMFERASSFLDFKLALSLALAMKKDLHVRLNLPYGSAIGALPARGAALAGALHQELLELHRCIEAGVRLQAGIGIVNADTVAGFKAVLRHCVLHNIFDQHAADVFDSVAEDQKTFSDERFQQLQRQVDQLQKQVMAAHQRLDSVEHNVQKIAEDLDALKDAMLQRKKRELIFGVAKVALSLLSFGAFSLLTACVDLSDVYELGATLLRLQPADSEMLLKQGMTYWTAHRSNLLDSGVEITMQKMGLNPDEFVDSWCSVCRSGLLPAPISGIARVVAAGSTVSISSQRASASAAASPAKKVVHRSSSKASALSPSKTSTPSPLVSASAVAAALRVGDAAVSLSSRCTQPGSKVQITSLSQTFRVEGVLGFSSLKSSCYVTGGKWFVHLTCPCDR